MDIELARENDIDSYETFVMRIEKDAERLTDIILSGDKRKIDREIKRFELKWKNYRNELLETYNPRKILCGKYLEQIKSAKILVKTADDDLHKILKTSRDNPDIATCQKYRIHIKPSRDAVSNFCLKYESDLPDSGVSWCKTLIEDIDTLDESKIPSFNYLSEIKQQLVYVNKSLEIAEVGCNSDISDKKLIQRFKNAEL